ncbi:MAG: flagellar biosynthetic protein FliO [Phycisphaerae bacterium]
MTSMNRRSRCRVEGAQERGKSHCVVRVAWAARIFIYSPAILVAIVLLAGGRAHAAGGDGAHSPELTPDSQAAVDTSTAPDSVGRNDRVVRRAHDPKRNAGFRLNGTEGAGIVRSGGPFFGFGWLAPVLGLALLAGAWWLLRRMSNRSPAGPANAALEVLARLPIGVKQHLLLVRMGGQVLLLGAGSDQVRTLAYVTDAEQAATLIGVAAASRAGSISAQFADALRHASSTFHPNAADAPDPSAEALAPPRRPLQEIRRRVRSLSRRLAPRAEAAGS